MCVSDHGSLSLKESRASGRVEGEEVRGETERRAARHRSKLRKKTAASRSRVTNAE